MTPGPISDDYEGPTDDGEGDPSVSFRSPGSHLPTITELKALQERLGRLDAHVAYIGETGFTVAHTQEERDGEFELEECPLHYWLSNANRPPFPPGYYIVTGHFDMRAQPDPEADTGWNFTAIEPSDVAGEEPRSQLKFMGRVPGDADVRENPDVMRTLRRKTLWRYVVTAVPESTSLPVRVVIENDVTGEVREWSMSEKHLHAIYLALKAAKRVPEYMASRFDFTPVHRRRRRARA